MPTTEQRLTTLETTITHVQAVLLLKPSLGEVKIVVQAVESRLDVHDTSHTSYEERISKLERWCTSLHSAIQGLNEDGNAITNNYVAVTAPTVNDDASDGYSIGSEWINLVTDIAYKCLDATTGAAVWKQTTA